MAFKQFNSNDLPKTLSRPILVDAMGLPRYWAVIWATLNLHHLEPSTETKKLRYLETFYAFADSLYGLGFLDDALGRSDVAAIGDVLEAYFISLRNRPEMTSATEANWQTCMAFVQDTLGRLNKNDPNVLNLEGYELKLRQLDSFYGQLKLQKSRNPDPLRSLPADVVSAMYEMLNPTSDNTPFQRPRTRWTVYLVFVCLLHLGLRRGEILLLPVNAVNSAYDSQQGRIRYWLNVEQTEESDRADPRHNKPGIKTVDSIRQIPLSEMTANLIQAYAENYRGKPPHPFLLNTLWDTPLSHESLTAYFQKISQALPKEVLKTLKFRSGRDAVTPHDLRHTCAVIRLNQLLLKGDSMEEALQKMRVFFGWTKESDMPRHYARAVFEDRLSSIWSNVMDDRVEMLRNIPEGL
jgi:integrase